MCSVVLLLLPFPEDGRRIEFPWSFTPPASASNTLFPDISATFNDSTISHNISTSTPLCFPLTISSATFGFPHPISLKFPPQVLSPETEEHVTPIPIHPLASTQRPQKPFQVRQRPMCTFSNLLHLMFPILPPYW